MIQVIRELGRIALFDMGSMFDEHGRLRPVAVWDESVRRIVSSIEVLRSPDGPDQRENQKGDSGHAGPPQRSHQCIPLVGTRPEAKALAALLVKAGVPGAVTVSLNPQPRISLAPYHLDDSETRGPLLILHWGHPPPDPTAGRR